MTYGQVLAPQGLLAGESRLILAHRRHAQALEAVKQTGVRLKAQFEELYEAGQELKQEHGLETAVTLPFPIGEAWDDWRVKHMNASARP